MSKPSQSAARKQKNSEITATEDARLVALEIGGESTMLTTIAYLDAPGSGGRTARAEWQTLTHAIGLPANGIHTRCFVSEPPCETSMSNPRTNGSVNQQPQTRCARTESQLCAS